MNQLREIWRKEGLSQIERDIYMTLFLNADPVEKSCSLSYGEIAKESKISKSTAVRNISNLVEKGLVVRENQHDTENYGRLPNKYTLIDNKCSDEKKAKRKRDMQRMKELADKLGYDLQKIEE